MPLLDRALPSFAASCRTCFGIPLMPPISLLYRCKAYLRGSRNKFGMTLRSRFPRRHNSCYTIIMSCDTYIGACDIVGIYLRASLRVGSHFFNSHNVVMTGREFATLADHDLHSLTVLCIVFFNLFASLVPRD